MAAQRHDLLQGTLDLLILKILARQPMHGYGVMQRLSELFAKKSLSVSIVLDDQSASVHQ